MPKDENPLKELITVGAILVVLILVDQINSFTKSPETYIVPFVSGLKTLAYYAIILAVIGGGAYYLYKKVFDQGKTVHDKFEENPSSVSFNEPETESEDTDNDLLDLIVENIINWGKNPPKVRGKQKEMKMTLSMTGYLSREFPDLKLEERLAKNRIDAVIDTIGIEAKYRPDQNEINRLYGQIDDYLRYLDHVIVVFFDTEQTQITNFERKIKSGGYDKKITTLNI